MASTKNASPWSSVQLHPTSGLDTRSRPADLAPGWLRYALNFAVTTDGKRCRRDGFDLAFSDLLFDNNGVSLSAPGDHQGIFLHNGDLHHQGMTRTTPMMLFESTDNTGIRRLFAGTQSSIFLLNETTAYWTTLIQGKGAPGSYWQAAELQNVVSFTNDVDNVQTYNIDTTAVSEIHDLRDTLKVTKARVIVQFNGFMMVMNVLQDGKRQRSRILWSDLNLPMSWDPGAGNNTLAGFQDLDYGDEILAAAPMLGALYVLTRRSIWRVTVGGTPGPFQFTRVYNEPKNQTGCIVYPRTLVSDGENLWYGSRDAIYNYNPYIPAPERQDWLFKASGVIFRKADTMLTGTNCAAPVAEYRPSTKELWFSWPSVGNPTNNWTLVAMTEFKTADIVDAGFTAISNYRRTPTSGLCQEVQSLLAFSSYDWCIKDIGGVFFREYAIIDASGDITIDLPLDAPPAQYVQIGYNSILRGLVPTGLFDREKIIRNLQVETDVTEQDVPCVIRLRLGNTYGLQDPNDVDDVCSVLWRTMPDLPLKCPDGMKVSAMKAKNLRPNFGTEWAVYEMGRYLYWELTILNADGTPAVGGDACLSTISFEIMARAKA